MKIHIFLLLVFLLLWPAWATTAEREKVNCPACATPFEVAVMMSSNNAGGTDRDFLQHAGGSQPVILSIGCCPNCHYANYVDDLLKKPKVPDAIKTFLKSGDFKFPTFEKKRWNGDEEGYSPRLVPAWAAYDARAQIVTHAGKAKPLELTNLYIKAAWCTRFEENPFSQECEKLDDASRKTLSNLLKDVKDEGNRSDLQIKAAGNLLGRLSTLTPAEAKVAAIWSAYTLRDHGENQQIAEAWPQLKGYFPTDLSAAVQQSADLEKHYQTLALQQLTQAIAQEPKVNLVYLAGELNRRLGNFSEARKYFKQAQTLNPPEGLKTWIGEQLARCPKPDGSNAEH